MPVEETISSMVEMVEIAFTGEMVPMNYMVILAGTLTKINMDHDLIAIKSDEHLRNWWYLKMATPMVNVDIIVLDEFDEIKILGVDHFGLRFKSHVEAKGLTGVGTMRWDAWNYYMSAIN